MLLRNLRRFGTRSPGASSNIESLLRQQFCRLVLAISPKGGSVRSSVRLLVAPRGMVNLQVNMVFSDDLKPDRRERSGEKQEKVKDSKV
jgi:hypothetical protein